MLLAGPYGEPIYIVPIFGIRYYELILEMLLIPSMSVLVSRALTLHAGHEIPGRIMILFLLRRNSEVTSVMVLPELIAGIMLVPTDRRLMLCMVWNYLKTVLCRLLDLVAIGQLRVPPVLEVVVSVLCMDRGIGLMGEFIDRLMTLFGIRVVPAPHGVT